MPLTAAIEHYRSEGYNLEESKQIVKNITAIEIAQMATEEQDLAETMGRLWTKELGASHQ